MTKPLETKGMEWQIKSYVKRPDTGYKTKFIPLQRMIDFATGVFVGVIIGLAGAVFIGQMIKRILESG